MNGETKTSVSGWSVDTAMAHVVSIIENNDRRYEERFSASEKAIISALASAERAVLKAEAATEKRFESVNEFRGTLDNQQRTLIPRSEVDVLVRGIEEKIAQLTKQADALVSERKGGSATWGYVVGAIGVLLALGSLGISAWK